MTTKDRILEKAQEAFVMAIEIYNKPTLKYRLEGFSFFICNAWELMLKAYISEKDGEDAIYYHDKPNRTISLENCIQKVFTNEKSPLRKNLEKVIELRNTSTHFITEEYEAVYIPLLQACVFNFVEKMMDFHGIDMTQVIPENFITLSVRLRALDETEIRGKYSKQIAEKLIAVQNDIDPMVQANNSSFAIKVEHYHYLTKNKSEATEIYHIDNSASNGVRIIKELKDPNNTHKYNAKACIKELNKRITRDGIHLKYRGNDAVINNYHFRNFTAYFGIKENEKMCFVYQISSQPQYSYSQQAIDFIYDQIKTSPEKILDDLHEKMAIKKSTPGAKEF
ncbi:DUF3644 domain-containing protein [Butyrivibrio sp.]|jgi:hypothetical protein|uniref:DUF3644 domain-containing protein n=1 Tax=Butyrivibrio sp. TaxID=28121 RepID=UPI0025C3D167|nr:DUF3644 domain-containing protein [Butyrivibrio sp.]MBE5839275.1 DUF3644 domain-containing protein [Butyrivibrio sp.]MBE5843215.1 DUF3644 domain-containing protein [Butyrivibrio sp.]